MHERELVSRSLQAFVPPGAFDAHAHLYRPHDAPPSLPPMCAEPERPVSFAVYRQRLADWMGDLAPRDGLFFTFPKADLDVVGANRFVKDEVAAHSGSRALLMVRPADDPGELESALASGGWAGFKVYHVFAARKDTFEAEPGEFVPEWAWELAHARGLAIMLHLVRSRALADAANQQYIRSRCRRYPGARLILAHAARGFCAQHTAEGIEPLRGLDNVFFDTSAVCEPAALEAILRVFGPTRLLFGTDFPVSEFVGRCVSIGDGFLWLDRQNTNWEQSPFARPIRVGVESLLALQQACRTLRLNDRDVERIFRDNARQLLGFDGAPAGGNQEAYHRAKQLIPGGTQLLSKRPEMYAPEQWPAYYREARGCEVIDLDERRYVDLTTSGIGSCLLGYADPDVTDAVVRRVQFGSMCTLNSPEELELAELLLQLHPWSEQVRFCRTGGEAMAVAVRIARAATRRDRVAFCGYHGWSDWYLAANLREKQGNGSTDPLHAHLLPGLEPAGVPAGLLNTALPFAYNCIDELRAHVRQYGSELAAVVMEPTRSTDPAPGFLEDVRQLCDECGALLIFDEISSGWRMHLGGVHLRYGVSPEVAVFAKALGNGHPIAAILGRRGVMDAAQGSFISSTYWTEGVGPAAAVATIHKLQRVDVPAHVARIGERFRSRWHELGTEHGVPVEATGHSALLHLGFRHPDAAALGTLFTMRMLEHGFLTGPGFYPSLAHDDHHLDAFFLAADRVFAELAKSIQKEDTRTRIGGPVRHQGFARLN